MICGVVGRGEGGVGIPASSELMGQIMYVASEFSVSKQSATR